MRLSRLVPLLCVFCVARSAGGQTPPAPEPEPAPPPEPPPVVVIEPGPAPERPGSAESGSAAGSALPPEAPPLAPEPATGGPAPEIAPPRTTKEPKPPPEPASQRAHSALTLEGKLGLAVRPESASGFQDEGQVGTAIGLSLFLDLTRQLSAGLEVDHVSLGRGTAIDKLDSLTIDYSVTSGLLGLRAYPLRTELLDLFVGLQLGVGIQGVAAAGTRSDGSLSPAVAYKCGGSDSPALQIGGGFGARLMVTDRWGVTGRVGGTGRRLSGDLVDGCARGIGTVTTIDVGLGLGYDFDLDP